MFQEMGEIPTPELAHALFDASLSALRPLFAERTYVGWLAVDSDQQIIGGAGVHVKLQLPRPSLDGTRVETEPVPLVVNVYTEPRFRQRGVARSLINSVMQWATSNNLGRVVLHASDAGRELYISLGFIATNEMRWSPPKT